MKLYMKYIDSDNSLEAGGVCTVLYEVIDNYAARQLLLSRGKFVGSNRKDKKLDYFLAECSISIEDLKNTDEKFQIITQKEFEKIWGEYCELYKDEWNRSKSKFKVGTQVQGIVEAIYPQGIIIKLEEETVAITNYDECINNSFVGSIYPHQCVKGTVKEYDEKNMWIVIHDSRITS